MRMRREWKVAAGAAVAVALAIGVLGAQGHAPGNGVAVAAAATPATITVSGSGSVEVAPDRATVTLGVTAQGSDAQTALTQDSRVMGAVIAAVEKTGVAARDIQTNQLQLSPQYGSGTGVIVGFQATNTVTVRLTGTSGVGPVIDAALGAGANEVQGVGFSAANPTAARAQAYQQALAAAKADAKAIASAAGLKISGIQSIVAGGNCCVQPMAYASAAATAATPVMAGQEQVTANLQVVFAVTP